MTTSRKPPTDSELESLLRRAAALPDAPSGWVDRAIAEFTPAARPPIGALVQRLVEQVAAVLRFDSWTPTPLPVGVRSVPGPTRHLLFSAQGRDIDLRICPSADAFAVAGQILGPDESGVVELVDADDEAGAGRRTALAGNHATTLDELGEFRLDGVRRGTYRLTLRVGDDEIALPPIAVGELPS